MAYQVTEVLDSMKQDMESDHNSTESGRKSEKDMKGAEEIGYLNVDGGATRNDIMLQMQADIAGTEVRRPSCVETTAMGASYLAGLAVGYWKDFDEIRENHDIDKIFKPEITAEQREEMLTGWRKAVECTRGWAR